MGNCQAVDTASLVIQHPAGKSEKLFWPIPASQILKTNPGHCVALLITTTTSTVAPDAGADSGKSTVRITRVKLLRPTVTLTLGHVYRLISTQEVMKGLVAKKQARMMKMKQVDANTILEKSMEKGLEGVESKPDMAGLGAGKRPSAALVSAQPEKSNQKSKPERQRQRSMSLSASRPKAWQPSLKSIVESHI